MPRSFALLALLAPAVLAAACSAPNGALFASEGSAGSGSGGGATGGSGGSTGASSSGTTSSGATSSGATSTSGTTSSGGTTSSSSGHTSTSSSSSSSTSSSTSSGTTAGACTNSSDEGKIAQLGQTTLTNDVTQCAQNNFLAEPGTTDCIQQATDLSSACVACFDTNVHCAVMHCFQQCGQGSGSPACTACLHTNCTPAFNSCSGLMGP